jgi:transcription initiation factor TFIIH subunit 4
LFNSENEWSIKRPTETDHEAVDLSFLDRYAIQKWDCILHCILGTKTDGMSLAALQTLDHAGLALM